MAVFATKGTGASLPARQVDVPRWLGLAAAPTLALMGGIVAISSPDMTICTAALPLAPINDMALMYLLMSVFHLSPWLRALFGQFTAPTEGE